MEGNKVKNILWVFGTIIVLGIEYGFCRFAMFDFHGMKQWPTVLGIVTLAVLALSLCLKKYWLSATTVLGYIGGFAIAILYNSDGKESAGEKINNLWIIWTVVLLICIVVGSVIESQKRLNRSRS